MSRCLFEDVNTTGLHLPAQDDILPVLSLQGRAGITHFFLNCHASWGQLNKSLDNGCNYCGLAPLGASKPAFWAVATSLKQISGLTAL